MVDYRQKRDAHSSTVDASAGWESFGSHPATHNRL